ncbi:hypothetical protein JW948_06660 [bacterium]|nr:hypothetical protein [bacterium]
MKKTGFRFITCILAGCGLILLMSLLTPKILWLRMSLLMLITYVAVQVFYFWSAPVRLKHFNAVFIPLFMIVSAFLTVVRHALIDQDFRAVHWMPVVFALIFPLISSWIYSRCSGCPEKEV